MTSDNGIRKFTLKNITGFLITIGLTVLFVFIAFYGIDLDKLLEYIGHASLFWILVFIILSLLSHYFRAVRWRVILHNIKPGISSFHLFNSVMLGYGVNNIIPRLGEISRAVSIGYTEQISRTSVLGTIVIERVLDILLFGAAVLISLIIYNGSISYSLPWLNSLLITGSISIGAILAVIFFLVKYKEKYITKFFPGKFGAKLSGMFLKLITGLSSLRGAKNYIYAALTSIMIMVLYALTSYAGFRALDIRYGGNYFEMAWVVMSIGAIGVMIPTPGGIGSYHTITKAVMVTLYGIDPVASLAFATVTHGISYLTQVGSAIIVFFYLRHRDETFTFANLLSVNNNSSQE